MEDNEINPIKVMIDDIANKNYTSASNTFVDLLNDKLKDTLEAKKIGIASSLFRNNEEAEAEVEDLEEYLEDEDV
jgi:hypothetical protein